MNVASCGLGIKDVVEAGKFPSVNFQLSHLAHSHNTLILLLYNVIGGGGGSIFTSLAAPATLLYPAHY